MELNNSSLIASKGVVMLNKMLPEALYKLCHYTNTSPRAYIANKGNPSCAGKSIAQLLGSWFSTPH